MSVNTELLNTHYYDKKLDDIYLKTIEDDNREMGEISSELNDLMSEVYQQLDSFIDYSKTENSIKKNAKMMLNNIKNSQSKIDPINNMNIEEILFRLNRLIQKEKCDNERLEYIIEQISDIITKGACLQGQSIRLFSCLKSFY